MNIKDLLTAKYTICNKADPNDYIIQGTLKTNGVPVLLSKNKYVKGEIVTCVRRMPQKLGKPWKIQKCRNNMISVPSIEPYLQPVTVSNKVLSVWDMYTSTMHYGSHSFVFLDKFTFLKSFKNIEGLSKKFKYNTCFEPGADYGGLEFILSVNPKDVYFIITIHNIKSFCPIFNAKNVDGLGIAVEVINIKKCRYKKRPSFKQNLYYILSNYKDNLFYVDGVNLQVINKNLGIIQYHEIYTTVFKKAENAYNNSKLTSRNDKKVFTAVGSIKAAKPTAIPKQAGTFYAKYLESESVGEDVVNVASPTLHSVNEQKEWSQKKDIWVTARTKMGEDKNNEKYRKLAKQYSATIDFSSVEARMLKTSYYEIEEEVADKVCSPIPKIKFKTKNSSKDLHYIPGKRKLVNKSKISDIEPPLENEKVSDSWLPY